MQERKLAIFNVKYYSFSLDIQEMKNTYEGMLKKHCASINERNFS